MQERAIGGLDSVKRKTRAPWKQCIAALLAALLLLPAMPSHADQLEDEKASYDAQAEEARKKSDELQSRIDSISEEKRILDEEADAAIADYEEKQAALDETELRIEENTEKLERTEKDYQKKSAALGKRVRDIYINGQISYLDVLFGAKDFSDFMTRMDLLKRVIRQDYDLVQEVLAEKQEMEQTRIRLERDRAAQSELAEKARIAKDIRVEKQRKRQALIDRMKSDKAVYDKQYDELMAASKQVEQMIRNSAYRMPTTAGSGGMLWPLSGPVTSEFGWRVHPIFGTSRFHSGLDIGGDYGLPICAAQSGVVSYAGWISGYGNTVMIEHGGGIVTLYGHNQSLAVGVGQQVSQGEVIAYCGSTGNSTGPHCHFEVRQNGEPVSPWGYL